MRQIYELYREVKRPLVSYSSSKSLKKGSGKPLLKRQNSSPYLLMEAASKVSRSKSPKRKNKSVDITKLKQNCPNVRKKLGNSF